MSNLLDGDVIGEKLDYLVDIMEEYRRVRGMRPDQHTLFTLKIEFVALELNIHVTWACDGGADKKDIAQLAAIEKYLQSHSNTTDMDAVLENWPPNEIS